MSKLNFSNREAIAICIVKKYPLAKIGEILNRSTSSISSEIKKHRLFVAGSYYSRNDCKYAKNCIERGLCGDKACPMYCYVCDACSKRRYCYEDRYFYDARVADKKAHETRVSASTGAHLTNDELASINLILKDCFRRLFGTVLTDNDAEFKRVNELEQSCITNGITRTSMYYCDPMASGQKGRLEKNHEYIRYVIPKGTSLSPFSQEDFSLLMNHINSTKRPSFQNRSPYELIDSDFVSKKKKIVKVFSI